VVPAVVPGEEVPVDIYVIGDENTVLGFSLVGVEGEAVESAKEARSALDDAVEKEGIKIILITEKWAGAMRERVDQLKRGMAAPLVLEIPGSASEPTGPSLRDLVEEAIGVRISGASGR
jgi:V/A-type H+-transporting ATPase subunit F